MGHSGRHRAESLLIQALCHRLKIMAWPNSPEVPRWQEEPVIFRMDAARADQPAMKRRLDLAPIYRRARHRFLTQLDGQPSPPLPEIRPMTLDQLLSE